ncbi:MAG: malto-oligosyltrehalose trehalohydrolase [Archangium sp.]|nr:malto-oligosyltrehalose trehalohydrolase [Archangium sp.]MDP3573002.1 malto-oligosyltrehalose trehalohydrolase [Archangium sp.]
MTNFQVWAPNAKQVELILYEPERRITAEPRADGLWSAPAPPVGTHYAVSLDGGPARPDPRSRLQPSGVHGPSQWIDPVYPWTDASFRAVPLGRGVIYELHVGTFTRQGTLDSALERLDELIALGITHVELMPLNAFPGRRGWGYDGVNLFAVHTVYGGIDALRRFVDGAHSKGLSVILDVVYNHLGPDGNYLSEFAPFFTERHKTPWGPAIDFSSPGVRRFFLDNALYWLRDCHLDGLRLDATHAIYDDSPKHILSELADEVRALERPAVLIAENEDNEPRLVLPKNKGGDGLDGFWFDDLHHAIHAAFTGEQQGYYAKYGSLADIETALVGKGTIHDRPMGPPDGTRCIACIQNHDQIGNRARGERLGQLTSAGRMRFAAALMLTSPFVPLLFEGEEWGAYSPFQYFTDHENPELAKAVQEGRRAEHASVVGELPDPQAAATMERSVLDWSERERSPHREMLVWYRSLLGLRHQLPELTDGRRDAMQVAVDHDTKTITLRRGRLTLVGTIGDAVVRIPTPPGRLELSWPEPPRRENGVTLLAREGCAIWVNRS